MDPKIRADVYKAYLMYTMSGEEGGGDGGGACTRPTFFIPSEVPRGGVCVYKAYLMYTMSGEQGGLSMTSQSKTSQGSPPRD